MGTQQNTVAKEGEIIILSQIYSSLADKMGLQICFVYFLHINISYFFCISLLDQC